MVFVYEWIHFLIHTAYRPRTSVYKAIWRNHRLHHFKNEHISGAAPSFGLLMRFLRRQAPVRATMRASHV